MSQKIQANEIYVKEFGAIIRTRCPKEDITEEMIHQRVVAANLSAGDTVVVQCFNHERTCVLSFAEFLVYDRNSQIRRIEINDTDTRQVEDYSFSIMRISDWKDTPAAPKTVVSKTPEVKWNPGRKTFQVLKDNAVVGESPDKVEATKLAAEAA